MPADRPSVLVVDDEAAVAEMYAARLRDEYAVVTAHDGGAAMDAVDGFDHETATAAFAGLTPGGNAAE